MISILSHSEKAPLIILWMAQLRHHQAHGCSVRNSMSYWTPLWGQRDRNESNVNFYSFLTMVGLLCCSINKTCSCQEMTAIVCMCCTLQKHMFDICTLSLLKDLYLLFTVVCVGMCACVCVHKCMCLQRSEVSHPWSSIPDSYEPSDVGWGDCEENLGPLREQNVPLTTESSLPILRYYFLKRI